MRPGDGRRTATCLLAAGLFSLSLAACGQLDKDQLSTQVESLQSLTQEGILMAQGVVDGTAHTPYVRVHAEEMASSASRAAEQLSEQHAPVELAAGKAKAIAFAKQISDQLKKLSDHPDDSKTATSVKGALQSEAEQIHDVLGSSK